MPRPARDISHQMRAVRNAAGGAGAVMMGNRLTPAEFSARLETSRRTLWLIAAGVLSGRADAEDCVQEAAMIGLSKVDDFDPATSFPAWMGGIVRNVARNHARKHARRHTSPSDPLVLDQSRTAQQPPGRPPRLDRGGHITEGHEEFDERVLEALNHLEETARACLLLRVLHEMPYREIAQWLGIPEGTAMSHVHRSRQALRRQLAPTME
jgi:RNA polymerase sigma-70 factor, ECF subfamily